MSRLKTSIWHGSSFGVMRTPDSYIIGETKYDSTYLRPVPGGYFKNTLQPDSNPKYSFFMTQMAGYDFRWYKKLPMGGVGKRLKESIFIIDSTNLNISYLLATGYTNDRVEINKIVDDDIQATSSYIFGPVEYLYQSTDDLYLIGMYSSTYYPTVYKLSKIDLSISYVEYLRNNNTFYGYAKCIGEDESYIYILGNGKHLDSIANTKASVCLWRFNKTTLSIELVTSELSNEYYYSLIYPTLNDSNGKSYFINSYLTSTGVTNTPANNFSFYEINNSGAMQNLIVYDDYATPFTVDLKLNEESKYDLGILDLIEFDDNNTPYTELSNIQLKSEVNALHGQDSILPGIFSYYNDGANVRMIDMNNITGSAASTLYHFSNPDLDVKRTYIDLTYNIDASLTLDFFDNVSLNPVFNNYIMYNCQEIWAENYISSWRIEASNNNTDWVVLDVRDNIIFEPNVTRSFLFDNDIKYRYIKFVFTGTVKKGIAYLPKFKLGGHRQKFKYLTHLDTSYSPDWDSCTYTVSYGSVYSSYNPYRIFSPLSSSYMRITSTYALNGSPAYPTTLTLDFKKSINPKYIGLVSYTQASFPTTFKLYGSVDNTNWNILLNVLDYNIEETSGYKLELFNITSRGNYQFYKFEFYKIYNETQNLYLNGLYFLDDIDNQNINSIFGNMSFSGNVYDENHVKIISYANQYFSITDYSKCTYCYNINSSYARFDNVSDDTPGYITFQNICGYSYKPIGYRLACYSGYPENFELHASNDLTNWDLLDSQTSVKWGTQSAVGNDMYDKFFYFPETSIAYKHFKLVIKKHQDDSAYSYVALFDIYTSPDSSHINNEKILLSNSLDESTFNININAESTNPNFNKFFGFNETFKFKKRPKLEDPLDIIIDQKNGLNLKLKEIYLNVVRQNICELPKDIKIYESDDNINWILNTSAVLSNWEHVITNVVTLDTMTDSPYVKLSITDTYYNEKHLDNNNLILWTECNNTNIVLDKYLVEDAMALRLFRIINTETDSYLNLLDTINIDHNGIVWLTKNKFILLGLRWFYIYEINNDLGKFILINKIYPDTFEGNDIEHISALAVCQGNIWVSVKEKDIRNLTQGLSRFGSIHVYSKYSDISINIAFDENEIIFNTDNIDGYLNVNVQNIYNEYLIRSIQITLNGNVEFVNGTHVKIIDTLDSGDISIPIRYTGPGSINATAIIFEE